MLLALKRNITSPLLRSLTTMAPEYWRRSSGYSGVPAPGALGFTFTRSGTALGWSGGKFNSYATNAPRYEDLDYIGLPGLRGLLIEGARTNLAQRSSEISDAYWTKANATVVADNGIAPDGTTAADLMYPSVNSTECHFKSPDISQTAAATQYVSSCYFKASGKHWAFMVVEDVIGYAGQMFDVTAGVLGVPVTVAGWTLNSAYMQNIGGGWWRCCMVVTTPAASVTVAVNNKIVDANGSAAIVVNGTDGLLVWGNQLEKAASFASSPIPTAGATATRNAETCLRTVVLPAAGFTDLIEFVAPPAANSGVSEAVKSISSGASANCYRVLIGSDGSLGAYIKIGGTDTAIISILSTGGVVWGARYRLVVRVQAGAYAAWLNGGVKKAAGSGTGTFDPTNLTQERLGEDAGAGSTLFGSIIRCNASPTLWRPPLDDAQCQALSALT